MPHRGVVHEVARREVVGAVDDDVPALAENAIDVVGVEPLLERDHGHVRIDPLERLLRREHLGLAEHRCRVEHLPLEVRRVDRVRVDDPERPHAGRGQVERCRRARVRLRRAGGRVTRAASTARPRRPRGSAGDGCSGFAARVRATATGRTRSPTASTRRSRRRGRGRSCSRAPRASSRRTPSGCRLRNRARPACPVAGTVCSIRDSRLPRGT